MLDCGIFVIFCYMYGFGSYIFKWINVEGEGVWIKYYFKIE